MFYMGQRFTTRHLNHVRSPLLTGYIRPVASTVVNDGLLQSPLVFTASSMTSATATELALPSSAVSSIAQLVSMMAGKGVVQGQLLNFLSFKNISTCVFAVEKVCLGFKQPSLLFQH